MINSKTAREAAQNKLDVILEKEMVDVDAKIQGAVFLGRFSTTINGLSEGMVARLKELGYKVEYIVSRDQRDPYNYYTVSW